MIRDAPLPPAPTDAQMNRVVSVLAPLERITEPAVYGVERIPERAALFVGNHTLFGLVDVPFMRRGIRVRGLGDHDRGVEPLWLGICRDDRETGQHALADAARVLHFDVRGAERR
jgi:hypothetical protein